MFVHAAIGETTPGSSVHKTGPAATRQDVFAGEYTTRPHTQLALWGMYSCTLAYRTFVSLLISN